MRQLIKMLDEQIPGIEFNYVRTLVRDRMGFLEWTGKSEKSYIEDGADSYLIENGKITAQTIHYTVKKYSD